MKYVCETNNYFHSICYGNYFTVRIFFIISVVGHISYKKWILMNLFMRGTHVGACMYITFSHADLCKIVLTEIIFVEHSRQRNPFINSSLLT